MSDVGKPERATQTRLIALFRDELGYRFLGDRTDRLKHPNFWRLARNQSHHA